jgi:hypothetical protein
MSNSPTLLVRCECGHNDNQHSPIFGQCNHVVTPQDLCRCKRTQADVLRSALSEERGGRAKLRLMLPLVASSIQRYDAEAEDVFGADRGKWVEWAEIDRRVAKLVALLDRASLTGEPPALASMWICSCGARYAQTAEVCTECGAVRAVEMPSPTEGEPQALCLEHSPRGWLRCTLDKGHDGEHVANIVEGTQRCAEILDTWPAV